MTHYDIDYSSLQEPEKSNKAIADIIDYWGDERFNTIVNAFRSEDKKTLDAFHLILSFGGLQGFPVKALYNHVYGEQADHKQADIIDGYNRDDLGESPDQ